MKNVEDIYPVSPMQEVMLLHALARRDRDALLNQFVFATNDRLDVGALEGAWQRTVQRHPMLRTAFIVEKVKAPLQVVRKEVAVKFEIADWRDLGADAQRERLARYCETDRAAGINPTRAPLMRFFLAQTDRTNWYFVWTSHHLLMDRWCLDTVLGDVANYYDALRQGGRPAVHAAPSFRHYINWLAQQDRAPALAYWARTLRGFRTPTPVDPAANARSDKVAARTMTLDQDERDRVVGAARTMGVTLGTVIQGAWALTLHKLTQATDIVFGVAVAARPPDIEQVEDIVGSFVNNLPLRVRLVSGQRVGDWLKSMQGEAYARSAFDYLSPVDIHRCSELEDGQALFDNLLVWLAPTDDSRVLPLTPHGGDFATAYPFTLSVADTPAALSIHVHRRAQPDGHARRVLKMLADAIETLAAAAASDLIDDMADVSAGAAVASTAAPVIDLPLIAPADDLDPALDEGRESIGANHMRQIVRDEMRAVLGVDEVGPDDDFFELGGDSIRAARLHAKLVAGTRRNVPLLALFRQPSVREMARTLCERNWPMTAGIAIPLQTRGLGAPLFCVASPEVNTVGYFVLSRHLPPERRSFVLQAPPASGELRQVHPAAIGELASDYLKAMKDICPHGPYLLLGMCSGAHIAVEMARQLHAAGERVAFLSVVNTWGFYTVSPVYYLHRLRNVLAYYVRRVRGLLPFARAAAVTTPNEPAANEHDATANVAPEEAGLDNPWIRDFGFARNDPGAAKIPGIVHVFRLRPQQYWRIRDRGLGWGKQVAHVKVHDLPGDDHEAILREPFVRDIAPQITAAMGPQAPDGDVAAPMPLPPTITTGSPP